jgi:hypothetical protein
MICAKELDSSIKILLNYTKTWTVLHRIKIPGLTEDQSSDSVLYNCANDLVLARTQIAPLLLGKQSCIAGLVA